ncbi:MAG: hypothetical protein GY720_06205 [bacterium]|nr:hypothetical protein [bacterium]
MADEHPLGGTMVVRAWRHPNGEIHGRVTRTIDGGAPPLEMMEIASAGEIIALLSDWLEELPRQ